MDSNRLGHWSVDAIFHDTAFSSVFVHSLGSIMLFPVSCGQQGINIYITVKWLSPWQNPTDPTKKK